MTGELSEPTPNTLPGISLLIMKGHASRAAVHMPMFYVLVCCRPP